MTDAIKIIEEQLGYAYGVGAPYLALTQEEARVILDALRAARQQADKEKEELDRRVRIIGDALVKLRAKQLHELEPLLAGNPCKCKGCTMLDALAKDGKP